MCFLDLFGLSLSLELHVHENQQTFRIIHLGKHYENTQIFLAKIEMEKYSWCLVNGKSQVDHTTEILLSSRKYFWGKDFHT